LTRSSQDKGKKKGENITFCSRKKKGGGGGGGGKKQAGGGWGGGKNTSPVAIEEEVNSLERKVGERLRTKKRKKSLNPHCQGALL